MLSYFVRRVIGGQTGKRESAWFVFLLFALWTGFLVAVEFIYEREMEQASSMWMVLAPFVIGWIMGAHGMEWRDQVSRARAGQSSHAAPSPADALSDALDPLPGEDRQPGGHGGSNQ
jgi:RsiW-degrading membrane proteinase PrsW (M82 family)